MGKEQKYPSVGFDIPSLTGDCPCMPKASLPKDMREGLQLRKRFGTRTKAEWPEGVVMFKPKRKEKTNEG